MLRTKDPTSGTGARESYPILHFPAGAESLGDPPALCFFMPFEISPTAVSSFDRWIDIGFVKFSAQIQFMQRRTETLVAALKDKSALALFLSRMC